VLINTTQSVEDGVLQTELIHRWSEVDQNIVNVLESIFGMENLQTNPTIYKLFWIGLASHLINWDHYDAPVFPTNEHPILSTNSPLRCIPSTYKSTHQWFEGVCPYSNVLGVPLQVWYFESISGLPHYVMIHSYIWGLEKKVQNIPSKIEAVLDKWQMAGPLSLDQIA
jgi:hypothetical protein